MGASPLTRTSKETLRGEKSKREKPTGDPVRGRVCLTGPSSPPPESGVKQAVAVRPRSLAAALPATGSEQHSAASFSIVFLVRLTATSRMRTWLLLGRRWTRNGETKFKKEKRRRRTASLSWRGKWSSCGKTRVLPGRQTRGTPGSLLLTCTCGRNKKK